MEEKELIREEIPLSEEGLKNKQLEKRKKETEIYKLARQVEEATLLLEQNILTRQLQDNINDMLRDVERKENSKGEKLTEADVDYIKIRIQMLEKDIKEDISNKTLRLKISDFNSQLEFEKHNLSVIEKQIREKKVISVHR